MSDRNRTRGLHRGTASHKPDCQCPPCTRVRAQKLLSDLKDAELQISTARLETTEAKGLSSSHFARAERLEKELKESQETALSLQQDLTTALENLRLAEQGRDAALKERDTLLSDKNALNEQLGIAGERIVAQSALAEQIVFEGTLQTLVASILVAVASFFVGRWAR